MFTYDAIRARFSVAVELAKLGHDVYGKAFVRAGIDPFAADPRVEAASKLSALSGVEKARFLTTVFGDDDAVEAGRYLAVSAGDWSGSSDATTKIED